MLQELLSKARPLMSAEFHSSLMEAVQEVENETGGSVTLDGVSAGYKKFAEKVKVRRTCSRSGGVALRARGKMQGWRNMLAAAMDFSHDFPPSRPILFSLQCWPDPTVCKAAGQSPPVGAPEEPEPS